MLPQTYKRVGKLCLSTKRPKVSRTKTAFDQIVRPEGVVNTWHGDGTVGLGVCIEMHAHRRACTHELAQILGGLGVAVPYLLLALPGTLVYIAQK